MWVTLLAHSLTHSLFLSLDRTFLAFLSSTRLDNTRRKIAEHNGKSQPPNVVLFALTLGATQGNSVRCLPGVGGAGPRQRHRQRRQKAHCRRRNAGGRARMHAFVCICLRLPTVFRLREQVAWDWDCLLVGLTHIRVPNCWHLATGTWHLAPGLFASYTRTLILYSN